MPEEVTYFHRYTRGEAAQIVRHDQLAKKQRTALSERQKQALYDQYCMGQKVTDLADAYGISDASAYRYISQMRKKSEEMRKEGEKMASHSKIVAGDKANGRLTSTSDPHRFEGTCIVGGKSKSRTFTAVNARNATDQWEKWCADLRDEQQFMDMVERKVDAVTSDAVGEQSRTPADDEPFVPTDEPLQTFVDDEPDGTNPTFEPDVPVRPWREVAEERQQRIDELEARVAELEDKERKLSVSDQVILDTEGETPKLWHWFNNNGAFRVFWMNKPVYVLWAKTEQPKLYGVYQTMESALKELDKLNDVARFLGSGDAFEVEEVAWR